MIKNFSICSRDYYIGTQHQNRLAMTRENFHIKVRANARDGQPVTALTSGQQFHCLHEFPGTYFLSIGSTCIVTPKWFNL